MLKGIRNSLLNYDIQFEKNGTTMVAKWDHIVEVWKSDCGAGDFQFLHKLTEHHVNPNFMNKMKVSVAVQTLSRSVAIALRFMAGNGKNTLYILMTHSL